MTRRRWTPVQKKEVRDRQDGLCACGCARPLEGQKVEYNHVRALCLGGADELWNIEALIDECHKPHTAEVIQRKSKADRQGGGRGSQYGRRLARASKGQRPLIQNAGFSKTMTRGVDGIVRERMK